MIDTIRVDYKQELTKENKKKISNHLVKTTDLIEKNKNLVLKVNRNSTSTLKEFLKIKNWIDELMQEEGKIMRVDLAFDSLEKLEENRKLFRAFLYCLSIVRYKETDLFETNSIHSPKNLKISKNHYETTIYDCQDKVNRLANTRIENRALYIRDNLEDKEKIEKEILRYNSELKQILLRIDEEISLLDIIDKFLIPKHIDFYNNSDIKLTIIEFIVHLDLLGFIFTKISLEKILKQLNYTKSVDYFVREYRRKRGKKSLKFISKNELKELIKAILQENKKTVL
jgi:hypothetical protein